MFRLYALVLMAALAAPVYAQTIVVNTLDGGDDGSCNVGTSDDCSILEAVALANTRGGADRIVFSVSGTITLSTSVILSSPIELSGRSENVVLEGSGSFDVVSVTTGGAGSEILDLTLTGVGFSTALSIVNTDDVRVAGNAIEFSGVGVSVVGSSDVVISNNVIRFNGEGVVVTGSPRTVAIVDNSIFDNGGIGIDIEDDGVSSNDPNETDNIQNAPVLRVGTNSRGSTAEVTLDSSPSTSFLIQVFTSDNGQGETLRNSGTLTTDRNGDGSVQIDLSGVSLGQTITATATRLGSRNRLIQTSEFSEEITVQRGVSFESSRLFGTEGRTTDLVLRLSEPAPRGGVSVDVVLIDGDADDLDDFETTTVEFDRGDTTAEVPVFVTDDGRTESPESFTFELQNPVGVAIASPSTVVLEVGATGIGVGFSTRTATVPENAGVYRASIRIADRVAASGAVDVVLVEGDPADVAGFESRRITLPRGDAQTITFDIPITDDAAPEPNETVVFALRNATGNDPVGFTIRDTTLTLTIVNDDGAASTVTVAPLDEDRNGRDDGGLRTFASPVGGLTAGDIARAAGTNTVFGIGPGGALVALSPTSIVSAGQAVALDAAPGTVLTLTGAAPIVPIRYTGVEVGDRVLVAIGNPRDETLDLGAITITNGTLLDVVSVFDTETDSFRPVSLSGTDADLDELALEPFEVAVLQIRRRTSASNVAVIVPVTGAEAPRGALPVSALEFETTLDEEAVVIRLRRSLSNDGDIFALRFGDGRPGLDPLDGLAVTAPFGLSVAGLSDGLAFDVIALEDLVAGPGAVVPLVVTVPVRGTYEIEVESAPTTLDDRPVRIEILDNGTSTSIADGSTFTFTSQGSRDGLTLRVTLGTAVDSEDESLTTPTLTAYPNPSAGVTTVALEVIEAGPVRVAVYDALGREVAILEDGVLPMGEARFVLEGLVPGAYVIRADGEGLGVVQSLTVVR
ncbi:Calx-beta domain-containing protein [Rubrivirga sp.]|uniref:Calx-beta domain-containing protein n=1 Tax=Rubrivirga sp. TaxID=1885344 RepID=UPI003C78E4EF